jgi:heptosyltransferase-3
MRTFNQSMNILFITSSRLGDAVLSTGLLDHIVKTYPGARITIACGPLPALLFEGVPGLERIIILKKQRWNRHWLTLWRQVAMRRWDMVVDLRDSIVSRTVRARQRHIYTKRINQTLHKAEQNAAVMGLDPPPAPTLWPTEQQKARAKELIPDGGPVLGIGPTANWIGKTWPADRFITLIKHLTASGGILPGARVAIFAAPGEEKQARAVLAGVPLALQMDMIARTDPGTAAAALARCALFIGNDSGLMHCAAAAGTPTVGLFGPSWPHLYRPWGKRTAFAQTPESYAELTRHPDFDPKTAGTLMSSLKIETVKQIIEEFWLQKCKAGA